VAPVLSDKPYAHELRKGLPPRVRASIDVEELRPGKEPTATRDVRREAKRAGSPGDPARRPGASWTLS
jgi:hypothetical protein